MVILNTLTTSVVSTLILLLAETASAKCTNSTTNTTSSLVAASYFTGYHADEGFNVSQIPWDKYTEIKYAFAETSADGSLNLTKSRPEYLPIFVADAKANGVKALVAAGGWSGSRYFSTSVGSAANRTAFVNTCLDLIAEYDLDGMDFDWEYPNKQSLGCNVINDNDTSNFLLFLQELRAAGPDLILTAASSLFPWNNATGGQSTDLGGFADVLDYIMVMNYDVFGAWSSIAGPNSPLASACDVRNNQGSADLGLAKWIAAGIPSSKLVLGVAAYGHGFAVNSTSAFVANSTTQLDTFPAQNSSHRFQGSSWDDDPPIDDCGNVQLPSGTYPFWSLITEAGFLDTTGEPKEGISYTYDDCSQTAVVYNATSGVWVSYDNAQSVAAKGQYIMDNSLGGFATWEIGGDYDDILINSVRSAVGLA